MGDLCWLTELFGPFHNSPAYHPLTGGARSVSDLQTFRAKSVLRNGKRGCFWSSLLTLPGGLGRLPGRGDTS